MKYKIILFVIFIFCLSIYTFSQTQNKQRTEPLKVEESLEFIASDLQEISKRVKSLNDDIVKAYSALSKSMGLDLTEDQQKILVSFEILNRAEQRLANLQKHRIELIEKQTDIRPKLAKIQLDLRRESIDRTISLRGTTDAEALREQRREQLTRQKNNLSNLLSEIQSALSQTNTELRETTRLVDQIRFRLFPAIYRELPKLEYEN